MAPRLLVARHTSFDIMIQFIVSLTVSLHTLQELIVGVTARLSLGSGKEVMPYLREDELSLSWSLGLTEAGNMGHIVPDHEIMLYKVYTQCHP